jgi:DNA-directed RNA polymerase specialized sigma24 family protein
MTTILKNKMSPYRDTVRDAYANGATLKEIAVVHGVSQGTVRNCLIEMGVELRPRGRKKRSDNANGEALPVDELTPSE